MSKKKVLLLCQYYFPGYRAGGPQQTIKNVVEEFGDSTEFFILTCNHDLGSTEKYSDVRDGWNQVGKAKVMYLADGDFNRKKISHYAEEMDIIYCCGLFENSTLQALVANKMNRFCAKFYIAAMGVFSEGAYNQKRLKKSSFIWVCKLMGLFRNVNWSFTSEDEVKDASRIIGKINNYVIAEDIPRQIIDIENHAMLESNTLKIVFLSRICAQKNLVQCLKILNSQWIGEIHFDIYGPIEDKEYWNTCQNEIKKLPHNVQCNYCGEVKSDDVQDVFANYDVFLFPTLGENFGHVIHEAMSVGCIPIISDTTPWLDLAEHRCGRVIKINLIDEFRNAVQDTLTMNRDDLQLIKKNAVDYVKNRRQRIIAGSGYKKIFLDIDRSR
jgi:glycosyltransferase involved in cell wall biosynthesis